MVRLLERASDLRDSSPKLNGDIDFDCIRAPDGSIANPTSKLPTGLRKHHASVTLGGYRGRVELRDSLVLRGPRRIVFRDLVAPSQPRLEFAHRMLRCRAGGEGQLLLSVLVDGRPVWKQRLALQPQAPQTLRPFTPWEADLPLSKGQRFDLVAEVGGGFSPAQQLIVAEPVISGIDADRAALVDRNVLLIIVDAMRGDAVGAGRQLPHAVAPTMDAWMALGAGYARAMSVSNQTRASTLALLQGQPPSVGQFHATSWQLKAGRKARYYRANPPLLTRRLARLGHRVAHIGHNRFLWASAPIGLDHGYDQVVDIRAKTDDTERITDEAIQWLRRRSQERFFLTVNYTAPHNPYAPPEGYVERIGRRIPKSKRRGLPRSYLGEIAYVDDHIGRLKAVFDQLSLGPDTLVIITADHGETFHPKHACWSNRFKMQCHANHGLTLYDEEIHIPLAFVLDGHIQPQTVERVVSHLGVAPTVLDVLGLPMEPRYGSRSLLANADAPAESAAYVETRAASGIRSWGHKLIIHHPRNDVAPPSRTGTVEGSMPMRELYDLHADPWETQNLLIRPTPEDRARAEQLAEHLKRLRATFQRAHARSDTPADSRSIDTSSPARQVTWSAGNVRITGGDAGVSYHVRLSPARCVSTSSETCTSLETVPESVELRGDVAPDAYADLRIQVATAGPGVDLWTHLNGQPVGSSRWKLGPFGLTTPGHPDGAPANRLTREQLERAKGTHPPYVSRTRYPELFFWHMVQTESHRTLAPEDTDAGNDRDDGGMSEGMHRMLKDLGYTQ